MQTRVACSHIAGGADTALVCFHVPSADDVCCGSRTHCAFTPYMLDQHDAGQLATGDIQGRVFYFFLDANTGRWSIALDRGFACGSASVQGTGQGSAEQGQQNTSCA